MVNHCVGLTIYYFYLADWHRNAFYVGAFQKLWYILYLELVRKLFASVSQSLICRRLHSDLKIKAVNLFKKPTSMCCVRLNTWFVQLFPAPHFGNSNLFNTLVIHTWAIFRMGPIYFYFLCSNIVDSCCFPFFMIFMPVFSSSIVKWHQKG